MLKARARSICSPWKPLCRFVSGKKTISGKAQKFGVKYPPKAELKTKGELGGFGRFGKKSMFSGSFLSFSQKKKTVCNQNFKIKRKQKKKK